MEYVLVEWNHDLDDEPYLVYSELDAHRKETRKVEFFRNGMAFAYGGDRGMEEALSPAPFPADLQEISAENPEATARSISRQLFIEVWGQVQEMPDGFMGMYF